MNPNKIKVGMEVMFDYDLVYPPKKATVSFQAIKLYSRNNEDGFIWACGIQGEDFFVPLKYLEAITI